MVFQVQHQIVLFWVTYMGGLNTCDLKPWLTSFCTCVCCVKCVLCLRFGHHFTKHVSNSPSYAASWMIHINLTWQNNGVLKAHQTASIWAKAFRKFGTKPGWLSFIKRREMKFGLTVPKCRESWASRHETNHYSSSKHPMFFDVFLNLFFVGSQVTFERWPMGCLTLPQVRLDPVVGCLL